MTSRSPRFRVSTKVIVKVAISTLISESMSHSILGRIAPQPHCLLAPYLRLVSLSLPTFLSDLMPFMPRLSPHKLSSAASRLQGSVQLRSAMLYVSPSPPTFPWIVLAVVVHSVVRAPCFFDVVFPNSRPAVPRPAFPFGSWI